MRGVDTPGLPPDHPWREASIHDRMIHICDDCLVVIPVTAADIQAGIRLFCPQCDGEMGTIAGDYYESAGDQR